MEFEHLEMDSAQLDDIKTSVREKYPNTPFPNVYHDVLWRGVGSRKKVEKRQAVVLEYDGYESVAALCSDDYMLIPHEWAIWRFEQVLDEMPQYGKPLINVNLYGDGAKMRLSATFPEVKAKIGKDLIHPRAGIKNSYDLSLEWESWFGARVERCTNGLLMFKKLSNGGGKHRMSLDLQANISQLEVGMLKLDEQYQIWEKWLGLQLNRTEAMVMLEESPLSDKQVENVLALPEIGSARTLSHHFERGEAIDGWFLNSVITQYMEHEMEDTPSRMGLEERMTAYLHRKLH